jgi:hypothetical protein
VRHLADEAVGGRPVRIDLTVRRFYCEVPGCTKVTFVEQVPGLTRRYQRRTPALQKVVDAIAIAVAGSAGSRLLAALHQAISWMSVLNALMRITLPARPVPGVIGIDEFATRKGHRYASIIIDAVTGARIDVLPDRRMATVTDWLRTHPGARYACRDGAAGYAQAITNADPSIHQVADRWHLWKLLAEAARKEVAAHSACWGALGPPLIEGRRAASTRERWAQVHDLRAKGVGLGECARRLNLSMNTVKRYDRAPKPEAMIHAPIYRPTLLDPYREHLRHRRAENPAIPLIHLLGEITAPGLHRQRQPAHALHRSGPRRIRPRRAVPEEGHRPAPGRPGQPARGSTDLTRQTRRGLPRDDRAIHAHRGVPGDAHAPDRQR